MKKYFKILAIATLAMLFVVKSYSQNTSNSTSPDQPKKTVEQRTASMMDEMTKDLTLTSDEVTKITPFATQFQKQQDADRASYKGNNEKLASAKKARIDKLSTQLKDILTPDQYAKFQDYLKNQNNNNTRNK